MSCDYNCEYSCEECDLPDMIMEFVKGYNQALEDLKFNLEEEKKAYAYKGHSLDTDKWLDDYLKSKIG